MDVFELRDQMVVEYAVYVQSFLTISDPRLRDSVGDEIESGLLWPEPRIGLNPSFESGGKIDDLADGVILHKECRKIFQIKSDDGEVISPLELHPHQAQAIETARRGVNYVLTTGTGSGKSLAYIIPIVDAVLREGPGKGIRAIVVYPMNALANSQAQELDKYLNWGYTNRRGPVTFQRYTGQETDAEKQAIIEQPPDILLTNYVMLELILTRVDELCLVDAAKGLRFLVFDEFHTYPGRQGADVAFLARRARLACGGDKLQIVGTSATVSSAGDPSRSAYPEAWVDQIEVDAQLGDWPHHWLLGFGNATSTTNERTMLPAVIPRTAVGNSFQLILPATPPAQTALLGASLSSFALDFIVRQKIGGVNLSHFLVKQLPVLVPETYDQPVPWDPGHSVADWHVPLVLELTYTAWDLAPWAAELGYSGPPFAYDEARREQLPAELDACFFHLYGFSKGQVEYAMESFPIVKRHDEVRYGEFRTKRIILESFELYS